MSYTAPHISKLSLWYHPFFSQWTWWSIHQELMIRSFLPSKNTIETATKFLVLFIFVFITTKTEYINSPNTFYLLQSYMPIFRNMSKNRKGKLCKKNMCLCLQQNPFTFNKADYIYSKALPVIIIHHWSCYSVSKHWHFSLYQHYLHTCDHTVSWVSSLKIRASRTLTVLPGKLSAKDSEFPHLSREVHHFDEFSFKKIWMLNWLGEEMRGGTRPHAPQHPLCHVNRVSADLLSWSGGCGSVCSSFSSCWLRLAEVSSSGTLCQRSGCGPPLVSLI